MDCGADYDEVMALDMLIPRKQWLEINPDDGGLLCANCLIRRASKLPHVINITGRITFAEEYGEGRTTTYELLSRGLP